MSSPIGGLRRGLRSVVIWVLISSVFSMFWVLDSAAQINVLLPVVVLVLATVALVAPTLGVHRSIRVAKASERSPPGRGAPNGARRRPDAAPRRCPT